MKRVLICIPLILALGVAPGLAQSGTSSGSAVSACTAVPEGKTAAQALDSCKAAIASYVDALKAEGKTQAQINALLGTLVYTLATSPALAGNAVVQSLVADAISAVADKIPDPTQKAAIQSVATEIRTTGSVKPETLTSAQSASTR